MCIRDRLLLLSVLLPGPRGEVVVVVLVVFTTIDLDHSGRGVPVQFLVGVRGAHPAGVGSVVDVDAVGAGRDHHALDVAAAAATAAVDGIHFQGGCNVREAAEQFVGSGAGGHAGGV